MGACGHPSRVESWPTSLGAPIVTCLTCCADLTDEEVKRARSSRHRRRQSREGPAEAPMTALTVTHIQADVRESRPGRRPTWDAYRVGWLPGEGWFCDCSALRSCAHLRAVRDAVAALDDTEGPR